MRQDLINTQNENLVDGKEYRGDADWYASR